MSSRVGLGYIHNYEPTSEVLILMALALMGLFFLSCLITVLPGKLM